MLYGDHGSPASAEHRPLAERQLRLPRYQVPLVLYAPKHLEPRVIHEVASQLDVLPTVVNVAGANGVNSTLGRDLFDPAFAERHYAFTIERIEKNPLLGLVSKDYYLQVSADHSQRELPPARLAHPARGRERRGARGHGRSSRRSRSGSIRPRATCATTTRPSRWPRSASTPPPPSPPAPKLPSAGAS